MFALQLQPNNEIAIVEVPTPIPQAGEALIRLSAAAMNRRDQWIREGKYPGTHPHITLGSDGCGVVEQVGSAQDKAWIGKKVVVNPNIGWGNATGHQAKDYRILGNPDHGTFAQYLCVPVHRLHAKPSFLSDEAAAAIPLAGLTAYRAVFVQAGVTQTDTVLITGIGGGVAQFALQFALTTGAKVYATSGDDEKLQKALDLGATGGVNYKMPSWDKSLMAQSGGFTALIDSAGGDQFNQLIRLMKPAGRMAVYGATLGKPNNFDMHRIFYYQIRLQGSTMGTDEEFGQMLEWVEKHQIHPILDEVFPFEQIISAFDKMKAGEQFGKIVVAFK